MTDYNGEAIYRLKASGKTWRQIETLAGLPHDAVRNRCRRYMKAHNLTPPDNQAQPAPETTGEQVQDDEQGNVREVESNSGRITTLDQLIAYCKIDLAVWLIERHVINKWEVGAKGPDGQLVIEPLFQVKVWLTKRNPEAIKPVISPVYVSGKFEKLPPRVRGLKSCLILPDPQFGFSRDIRCGELTPFHDRAALDVILQIAQVLKPDMAVFAGDVNDWSGWSDKYVHRPEFYFTTQPALIEAAWYIGQIRKLTSGTVSVIEGNHDVRPENMIITHLVDAYGLRSADQLDAAPVMSIDNLLGLSRMGVEYVKGYPDSEVWINETTRVIHGDRVRSQPGQTAAAVVRDAEVNTIYAHIHRAESATRTIPNRTGYRTVTALCPGCLCHVDGRVPGSKRSDQWQQGAAVVWYDDNRAAIQSIGIYNGAAVFQGELYQGRDYKPPMG